MKKGSSTKISEPPKKKRNYSLLIGVIIVIIALIVYNVYFDKDSDNTNNIPIVNDDIIDETQEDNTQEQEIEETENTPSIESPPEENINNNDIVNETNQSVEVIETNESGSSTGSYTGLTTTKAKKLIDESDVIILDVSSLNEYNRGHIPESVHHPLKDGTLENNLPSLSKNKSYLVTSHSDGNSRVAAQMLIDSGFNEVYYIKGSYALWITSGYDYEKS